MVRKQIASRGDIYHLDLAPSAGREQRGPHYAIVVSTRSYNAIAGMPYVVPVTTVGNFSRIGGFAVNLTGSGLPITGVAQLDQMKAVDLIARNAQKQPERVPADVMEDIMARLTAIFEAEED